MPFEPSIPAQQAALGSLNDDVHLQKTLKVTKEGMNYFSNQFKKINFEYIPSSANFITIVFKSNDKASKFVELMMRNGVILRGLKSFGLPNCVRVTIGTMDENKYFIEKIHSLKNEI